MLAPIGDVEPWGLSQRRYESCLMSKIQGLYGQTQMVEVTCGDMQGSKGDGGA